MAYDLVILDLDGTIADTVPGIADAVATTMVELGLPAPDEQKVSSNIGGGARNLVANLLGNDHPLLDGVLAAFCTYYDAHAEAHTTLYPDVVETLQFLSTRTRLAIATAKTRVGTMRIFDHFGLTDFFDPIITMTEMVRPKPDPWCINEIQSRLGIDRADTLYVGDTLTDVLTSQNAGIDCWIVTYGYGINKVKERGGYTRLIDGFATLREAVPSPHADN